MPRDVVTIIDEHAIVCCSVAEAEIHLSEPAAVAAWFGARYHVDRTTIDVGSTRIEFRHPPLRWHPDQLAVVADGTVSGLSYYAYLTLRAVVRVGVGGQVREATEIWLHFELLSRAPALAGLIRTVLRHGLHHLRSELDVDVT